MCWVRWSPTCPRLRPTHQRHPRGAGGLGTARRCSAYVNPKEHLACQRRRRARGPDRLQDRRSTRRPRPPTAGRPRPRRRSAAPATLFDWNSSSISRSIPNRAPANTTTKNLPATSTQKTNSAQCAPQALPDADQSPDEDLAGLEDVLKGPGAVQSSCGCVMF